MHNTKMCISCFQQSYFQIELFNCSHTEKTKITKSHIPNIGVGLSCLWDLSLCSSVEWLSCFPSTSSLHYWIHRMSSGLYMMETSVLAKVLALPLCPSPCPLSLGLLPCRSCPVWLKSGEGKSPAAEILRCTNHHWVLVLIHGCNKRLLFCKPSSLLNFTSFPSKQSFYVSKIFEQMQNNVYFY